MILIAVISLGAIGAIGAVFLYAASKKFEVYEDPRIAIGSRQYLLEPIAEVVDIPDAVVLLRLV